MNTQHERKRDSLGGWAVVLVSVLLWSMMTSTARAVPPSDCANTNRNVEVTQSTQQGNHQGIRSNYWFATGGNACARADSIEVWSGLPNGFMEFGWYLGWYDVCSPNYASTPRLFSFSKPNNGAGVCTTYGNEQPNIWRTLSVADPDSDTVWLGKEDGSPVFTINLNFDRGTMFTNGERDCTCDSAFAHFKSLDFQVSGSSAWNPWTDPEMYLDTDDPPPSGYHWSKISDTEHKVIAGT